MKQFLYFWRLGWVAFIAFALAGFGLGLLSRAALFLLGLEGVGGFKTRMAVTGAVFLVLGLPYLGWVFVLAMKKAAVLVPPTKEAGASGEEAVSK